MTGRAIVVRSLAEAEAALAAATARQVPVTLLSAENAANTVGPLWFRALIAQARTAHPGAQVSVILDCGDRPGSAAAALRLGFTQIRFSGRGRAREAIAAIAAEAGAEVLSRRPEALDLAGLPDPCAACETWLGKAPG